MVVLLVPSTKNTLRPNMLQNYTRTYLIRYHQLHTATGYQGFKKRHILCLKNGILSLDRWLCTADYTHTTEPIFHTLCFTWTTQFLSLTTSFKTRDTRYQNVKSKHSECLINATDVHPPPPPCQKNTKILVLPNMASLLVFLLTLS